MVSFSPKIRKLYKIGATKFITLPMKLIGESWLKQLYINPTVFIETLNSKEFIVHRKEQSNSYRVSTICYGLYCCGLSQHVVSPELYYNLKLTNTIIVESVTKDYVHYKLFIK